jgi:hypothetical protein
LFRRLVQRGWHPWWRINAGGTCRPAGTAGFRPLTRVVPRHGARWLACWEVGYTDPWLILTDLPPEVSDACGYGLRAWIEPGWKVTKRAGWPWHRMRMTDAGRAARRWRAVAVATRLRLVRVFRQGWNPILVA